MTDENKITEVQLKNGEKFYHIKSKDSRHVFFKNLIAMNWWVIMMLIFILITAILMSYYQVHLLTEIGERLLRDMNDIKQSLGVGTQFSSVITLDDGYSTDY